MNVDQQVETSVLVASATLLVYDFLCTLDLEIHYVWSRLGSTSALIFLLNRYPPFIDTFLSLSLKVTRSSPERCYMSMRFVTWLIVFGIILAEIILMLRTYAIWACRRWVMIGFILLGLMTFVPAIVLTQMELDSLIYAEVSRGCSLVHASPVIIIVYILLAICETIIAIMMAIKAIQHLPTSQSDWVASLYKDGLLFYAFMLVISLSNVFVPILNPSFANMLATPQRVFHSIICNRIIFLVLRGRSATHQSTSILSSTWDDDDLTSLAFAHNPQSHPPPQRCRYEDRFSEDDFLA